MTRPRAIAIGIALAIAAAGLLVPGELSAWLFASGVTTALMIAWQGREPL